MEKMAHEKTFSIDDVIKIMEEFCVTNVSATVTFDVTDLTLQKIAELYELEQRHRKAGDINVPYLFLYNFSRGNTLATCGVEFPTVVSFKSTMDKFNEQSQDMPHDLRGYYPGGTHPVISRLKIPLSFQMHQNGPRYTSDSNLDAIRANGYRYPFAAMPNPSAHPASS